MIEASPVLLDGDEWQAYFRDFKRSAFRLEVHQTYTMPFEAQTLRDHAVAGRTMGRAKIVRRPLTPYSRYLFEWAIPGNVTAGEDYQIVDVTERENMGLPDQDFWLFDETTVVHLNYRPDGTQINRELIQEPDIGKYLAWRDLALESAVPFSAYRT